MLRDRLIVQPGGRQHSGAGRAGSTPSVPAPVTRPVKASPPGGLSAGLDRPSLCAADDCETSPIGLFGLTCEGDTLSLSAWPRVTSGRRQGDVRTKPGGNVTRSRPLRSSLG